MWSLSSDQLPNVRHPRVDTIGRRYTVVMASQRKELDLECVLNPTITPSRDTRGSTLRHHPSLLFRDLISPLKDPERRTSLHVAHRDAASAFEVLP